MIWPSCCFSRMSLQRKGGSGSSDMEKCVLQELDELSNKEEKSCMCSVL